MWKAAFTGRSERSERSTGKGDDAASTSGRSERRRHRSGSDGQSVVSTASRRTDGDRKRRSEHSRQEPSVTYGAAPVPPRGNAPRSLTESAVNAFNADVVDEDGWEDDDGKSAARSRRGDSKERRKKSSRSGRERSRSRERDATDKRRRETRSTISEKSRGKSSREDTFDEPDGASRAIPEMGSFEQFPGMYDADVVRPPDHHMSGGLPYDPHVQSQFPGQNPSSYARPAFDPNPHGAAADYYNDRGESVVHQPGIRANTPMMLHNPDAHLVTPSAVVQPAQDTGQGAAADYYGGPAMSTPPRVSASSTKPAKPTRQSSGSSTSKPTKKPSRTNSAAAVAATAAALGGAGISHSQHHSQHQTTAPTSHYGQQTPSTSGPASYASPSVANTNGAFRPVRHNSEPVSVPGGGYYTAPPAVSGKPGKSSSPRTNHTGLYTAAGAAATGFAAYEMKQHHDQHHKGRVGGTSQYGESSYGPSGSQYGPPPYGASQRASQPPYAPGTQSSYYGPSPGGMAMGMERRHEHRGPISRLKDGVLNLIADPDDVRRMEEYTEYIGVCKYCFDPRTSPSSGPRQHHYHGMKRDSFESLRRRSMERLRRRGSGESLRRAGSKIDKDSRYYPSDRKGASKSDLLAGGLAAAGVATAAGAMFNDRKDFDDTYSVKSGHRAGSAYSRRSRSSSHERRRRTTHGVIGGERRDEFVTVRTKDGRLEKRKVHRSRSRSVDRKSGFMGAAAGAALGAGSVAAASSRHRRDSSPERVFVRHADHEHRSRSRSHSPGLGEILGFTGSKSQRSGRSSPSSSTYDISRRSRPATSGGVLGGFFSPSEKKQKKEHRRQKKSGSFFTFSNGSSSSSNSELAFGDAFSSRSSLGRVPSTKKKISKKSSDEKLNTTLLGIGATAAALAAAQKGSKFGKRNSRPDLKRDGRARRHDEHHSADEDEWEDEVPSDDASSVASGLAFGSAVSQRRLSRQSMESVGSQSSAGGLGAWDWRWGSKKQKRRASSPSQPQYPEVHEPSVPGPIAASIAAGSTLDAYGRPMPSESVMTSSDSLGQAPMQYVDPRPVSDTGSRYSSMPGAFDDSPIMSRPGLAPLQQPQPITPIQPAFTQAPFEDAMRPTADAARPAGPRRTVSSPINGSGSTFMQDAALIGGAALATGSIIASQGRRSKEPGSVRFGFTEEQQKKVDREIKRERDREQEDRRKADRTRALKEEAERFARDEDDRRARAERARALKETREREAAAAATTKRETEEEAMLRESREREEAYRREQARFAEEARRRYDEQLAAEQRAAKEEVERREQHEREVRAEDERKRQEAAEQERVERESKASDRKGKSKSSDSSERKSKKGERSRTSSTSSKSWQAPVAAGVAGALAGAVLDGALHKEARESKDDEERRDRDSRNGRRSHHDNDRQVSEPYIAQTVEPTDQKSGAPITDDDLMDPDFFNRRRSASEVRRYEDLARKATDKVVSERESYYQKPSQSQKDFFMPKELLDRAPEGKERVADPLGDNDVRVYHAADEITGEPFAEPSYNKGYSKSGSDATAKSSVPKLNLIAPTPPHSIAGSVKGDRSIPPSPLAETQDDRANDDRMSSGSRRPSSTRGISWGEDTTHVYQVRTPDSYREGDGYMASYDMPASAQTPLDEVVVELAEELPRDSTETRADLDDIFRGARNGDGAKGFYQRPFFDSVSDFTSVQTPGTEGAPPVRGWVEGETNEPTPAEEKTERMPGGFEDAVYEHSTREGRPESAFTHHDSREIDPNVKVPGDEAAWEPPMSKKDKKKREKAAKRAETFDDEPTTPVAVEREPEPKVEPPSAPAQEEQTFPMSKKDKKKRDKAAKQASAFDNSEPTTPAAERAEPVAEPEPDRQPIPESREPEPEPAWEPPLSKKEQKKRDKAAKKGLLEESEPTTPVTERSEPEQDFVTPAAESQPEPAWEPPLSKKEQKKRDKAAKQGMSFDSSEPATPTAEHSEPEQDFVMPAAETQPEPAWEPPLSKKEQKKREKEAKKQGFADVAESLMTAGGVAAVVGAMTKPEDQDDWSQSSGKKSKKGKKKLGEPLDDDLRDIEPPTADNKPVADEQQHNDMPGTWEATPAPTPATEMPSAPATQEPSAEDEWGSFDSKKPKKKKRDSSRFNEPVASSPLRSEVAFDDYVGARKAEEPPYTNGHSKEQYPEQNGAAEQPKSYAGETRISESPRRTSPDDAAHSVVSAPSDERRRSKSGRSRRESDYYEDEPYAFDDTRSVAASEPAGVYDSSKSSKRRSKHRDDDTASVTSSRSKRDDAESPSAKKEKKGGLFGLFSRKSSDGVPLSRTSTKDSKDGKDREDDEERRERRHRRKQTGSEYGDDDARSTISSSRVDDEERRERRHRRKHAGSEHGDDDARSTISSSSRRHRRDGEDREDSRGEDRRRHGDSYDDADRSSRHGSESRHRSRHDEDDPDRPRHHRRHRSGESTRSDKDQSFLGERVEDLPPLPATRPASPAAAPVTEEQALGTPVSAAADDVDRAVSGDAPSQQEPETTDSQHVDLAVEENQALPTLSQSHSRPSSPTEYFHQRPVPPTRPLSSTAVPLRFRHPPSSPMAQRERAPSFSSPVEVASSPSSPSKTKAGRHEFRNSGEFRPLYLVSRNAKIEDVEEQLPSLPSSKPSSRSSSIQGSEDWHSAAEDITDSPPWSKGLKIDPESANKYVSNEDPLGSQQTTPKAIEFEDPLTAKHYPKSEPQYYTWDDYRQDERLHEAPQDSSAPIDFSRPPLSQTSTSASLELSAMEDTAREESPTRMSKKDKKKYKGLAAAAMLGAGAGALLAHENAEKQSEDRPLQGDGDQAGPPVVSDAAEEQTRDQLAQTEPAHPTSDERTSNNPPNPESLQPAEPETTAGDDTNIDDIWGEGDVADRPITHREVPVEDRLPERPSLSRKSSKKAGKKGKKGKVGSESQADNVAGSEGPTSASFVEPEADFDDWFGSASTKDQITEEPTALEAAPADTTEPTSAPATPEVSSALFDRGSGGKSSKKKGKKGKKQSQTDIPADVAAETGPANDETSASATGEQDRSIVTGESERTEVAQPSEDANVKAQDVEAATPLEASGSSPEKRRSSVEPQTETAPAPDSESFAERDQPADPAGAPPETIHEPAQEVAEDFFAPTISRKQSKKSKKKQKAQPDFEQSAAEPVGGADQGISDANQRLNDEKSADATRTLPERDVSTAEASRDVSEPIATADEEPPTVESENESSPQATDDWSAPTSGKRGNKGKKSKKQAADPWAETTNDQTTGSGDIKDKELVPASEVPSSEKLAEAEGVSKDAVTGEASKSTEEDHAAGPNSTYLTEDPVMDDNAPQGRETSAVSPTSGDDVQQTSAAVEGTAETVEPARLGDEDVNEVSHGPDPATTTDRAVNEEASTQEPASEPTKDAPASRSWFPWSWGSKKASPAETKAESTEIPKSEAEQVNTAAEVVPGIAADPSPSSISAAEADATTREVADQPTTVDYPPEAGPAPLELTAPIESEPSIPAEVGSQGTGDAALQAPEALPKSSTAPLDQNVDKGPSKDAPAGQLGDTNQDPAATQQPSTSDDMPIESTTELTGQPDYAPVEEPATEDNDFWAPTTSKKKKGKKGKKSQGIEEETSELAAEAIARSAPREGEGLGTASQDHAELPEQGNEEALEPAELETPGEEFDSWAQQTTGKKKKKSKKSFADPSLDAEQPTSVEPPIESLPETESNSLKTEDRVVATSEDTSGFDALDSAAAANIEDPQVEPEAESFWTPPASKKKGKKGKKTALLPTEEASPAAEPAVPEASGMQNTDEAKDIPDAQPMQASDTPMISNAPAVDAESEAPPAPTEEDFWDAAPKGKKGKKGKKTKQAQAEEAVAPTESAEALDATEGQDTITNVTDEQQEGFSGIQQTSEATTQEAAREPSQEDPQEAGAEDIWALPVKGKKGKKARKGKRDSEIGVPAQDETQPANGQVDAQFDDAAPVDATEPNDTSNPEVQPAESTPAEDNDDWSSFGTGKKGKKAKKARKAAFEIAFDNDAQASSEAEQKAEPAETAETATLDGAPPADTGTAGTDESVAMAAQPSVEEPIRQDVLVSEALSVAPGDANASSQELSTAHNLDMPGSGERDSDAVAREVSFDEKFGTHEMDYQTPEAPSEAPVDEPEPFAVTKKSKKDKKKAKKSAAPAVMGDESPGIDTSEATGRHDDGMTENLETPTDSASAEITTIEQTDRDGNGDIVKDVADEVQGQHPERSDQMEAMPTKKSKKDKKKAKKTAAWEFEEPSAPSVEPLATKDEDAPVDDQLQRSHASQDAADATSGTQPATGELHVEESAAAAHSPAGPNADAHADVSARDADTLVSDEHNAAVGSNEQMSGERVVDPTAATDQPLGADADNADVSSATAIGEDDTTPSVPTKKSKKDKRNAKKAAMWDAEEPVVTENEQETEPATSIIDDKEKSDELPTNKMDTHSGLNLEVDPARAVADVVPLEQKPMDTEAEADQSFSTKKSKKDKKKAKKSVAWDSEEPAIPADREPTGTDDFAVAVPEPVVIGPDDVVPPVGVNDQIISTGSANDLTESNPVDDEPEQSLSTKKSKKDKKKAKKTATWDPEEPAQTEGREVEGLTENISGQPEDIAGPAVDQTDAPTLPGSDEQGMIDDTKNASLETGTLDAEADQFFSAKKSKKDKKKGKKATIFNSEEPEAASNTQLQHDAPIDTHASAVKPEETPALSQEVPAVVPEASTNLGPESITQSDAALAELNVPPEAPTDDTEDFGIVTTKKSKKDKKKAKKSTAFEYSEPETAASAQVLEEVPADVTAGVHPEFTSVSEDASVALPEGLSSRMSADPAAATVEPQPDRSYDNQDVPVEDREDAGPTSAKKSKKDKKEGRKADQDAFADLPSSTGAEETPEPHSQDAETPPEPNTETSADIGTNDATREPEEPAIEDFASFPTKKSKKDKKKAKKGTVIDPEATTGLDHGATDTVDNAQVGIAEEYPENLEPAVSEGPALTEMTASEGIDRAIEDVPTSQAERSAAGEDEGFGAFTSKKNKKEKKKAKKTGPSGLEPYADEKPGEIDTPDPGASEETKLASVEASDSRDNGENQAPSATKDNMEPNLYAEPNLNAESTTRAVSTTGEEQSAELETRTSANDPTASTGQDVDFAATLAAGLADSGFDPNLVVDDPNFHRRGSPPGQLAEADPEEAFPESSKKNKKSKRKAKGVDEAAVSDVPDIEVPESDKPDNDFEATLAQGLQNTGFDAALLARAATAAGLATSSKLEDEDDAFFAIPKKNKKGKKARRSITDAEVTQSEINEDAPSTSDVKIEPPLENEITTADPAQVAQEPSMVTSLSGMPAPSSALDTTPAIQTQTDEAIRGAEVGEDEWALPGKKKGKKGKKQRGTDYAAQESSNQPLATENTGEEMPAAEASPETFGMPDQQSRNAYEHDNDDIAVDDSWHAESSKGQDLQSADLGSQEAGEDVWAFPTKKKKGKKGKKQETDDLEIQETQKQPPTPEELGPEMIKVLNQQQEPAIEPSTQDPTVGAPEEAVQSAEGETKPTEPELQEAGEDEWAAPVKEKKGKKGKKREEDVVDKAAAAPSEATVEIPATAMPDVHPVMPEGHADTQAPFDRSIDSSSAANLDHAREESVDLPGDSGQQARPDAPIDIQATADDQPVATLDEQAQPMKTEVGEDEWAPTNKKKGKKSKKKVAASDADLNPFLAPALGMAAWEVAQPAMEQTKEPIASEQTFAPIAAESTERAVEAGIRGDAEMDIDEMDKAYKAYKKNKRKQKKIRGAGASEGGAEEPITNQSTLDAAKSADLAAASGNDNVSAVQDRSNLAEGELQSTHADATLLEPQPSEQRSAPDASPMSSSKVQDLSPGLQRLKRRAPPVGESGSQGRSGVIVHTSEVSQHLPATVDKSPSPQPRPTSDEVATPIEDARQQSSGPRSGDDVFAPESSRGSGAANAGSSWSFDALNSQGSSQRGDRDIPSIRASTSRESLSGRRSAEPLHVNTGSSATRGLDVPQKQEGDELQSSPGKHARTPSYETPLEATSRNRASYLFQSPPNAQGQSPGRQVEPATPDNRTNDMGYFNGKSIDDAADSNSVPLSPPPAGPLSPRIPLDTIPEESNAHKRHLAASNMAVTERAGKSVRRTDTPKAMRDDPLAPVTGKQATATASRSVSTPVKEPANPLSVPGDETRSAKRVASDHRSPSAMSNRSTISLGQHKTPEERRSISGLSNRSSSQTLRRVHLSGDLRAVSRASNQRGTSETGSAVGTKTIPFEPPPTPPLNEEEFDGGASRATNMADFYQGYGDAQGSQASPTRPPSVRKRQSMHIMELENKLDQLNSENQALQNARLGNQNQNVDGASLQQALEYRDLQLREKDNEIEQIRAMLQPMQQEIDRLMEMNGGLSEANRNLAEDTNGRYATLQAEHAYAQQQWQNTSRELDGMREEHGKLTSGMRDAIAAQLSTAMAGKDHEIRKLREELEVATERIRALQVQIQSSKGNDFLVYRDEDYFDGACQKLCQHVQQWVLRFSKTSDSRICRLSSDLKDDKLETRLDNALLDGSDVDKLLGDRVRRRDVFMSVVMTMVWEYVFTRYLFGMDREQRQKLKQLEKTLSEVGPPRAVAQWRATTLTLLSKRPTFAKQCTLDTEAVAHEIFGMLCALLAPPKSSESQLLSSLQKVIGVAVDLSIEMRTQRSEYIMLPPLQPEYDTNGDLVRKVTFNASLMNERSGAYSSNEELEAERAIVKIVLFPLVVKKGDESGEGEEEIVVCPAQVLVHPDGGKARKVVRVMSGAMEIDEKGRSRQSLISERPGSVQMF